MEIYLVLLSTFACISASGLESSLVHNFFPQDWAKEIAKIALSLFGYNTQTTQKDVTATNSSVCHSSVCLRTATEVLGKMKPEIEPCDDFYQFACGTFIDKTAIPADMGIFSQFKAVAEKIKEQLKDIILQTRPERDPQYLKLPNTLYKACMNASLVETLGSKPMQLHAINLGGWPVLVGDTWDNDNAWNWQDAVMISRVIGFNTNYMLNFSIGVDSNDTKNYIINIDKPVLGLNIEHWVNETLVSYYHDYMVDLAVLFGADSETATKELEESLWFEQELAYISQPKGEYNLRSIKQLQEDYPYIQWLSYINALLPKGLYVDENEIINLLVPSFFEDLGKLLNATKKRTIANYLMWRIHEYSATFLSENFRKRKLKYINDLLGNREHKTIWKNCEQIVLGRNPLRMALNSLYIRKYFEQDTKDSVLKIMNSVGSTFLHMLDEAQWVDNTTKYWAMKKLHSMSAIIGYSNELLDHDKMEKHYRELHIDSSKYFESILKLNVFSTDYSYNKLRSSASMQDWIMQEFPTDTNAYYLPHHNVIIFPAGILQGHFFNRHRHMYMNYGTLGSIGGHEFAHSLQDIARQYDDEGKLMAYLERVQCIIEQYGNYTDKQTGLKINGTQTHDENIADNIGIKLAYAAYKQWVNKNGEEPQLPGLNYTSEQMFWISTAQTWCSKYRREYLESRIIHSSHSPHEFHVLGSLSNMKDFAHDFKCNEGARMNPAKKCQF